ncbi:hypothetical protein Aab01nite_63030 [Paractinoplanes abujensis]|uniref:DUF4352 domain-containing protein n=1 Tax=Paractinoplanes abujensis TaxID=882441 RepID=A0A7W7CQG6_9ACTN|nr:hypothetical protein [Actinoplanes abujensis]MBB4692788.1 hypothetical protein [Actinoplanes abujensis]GID22713.1 hypothetical protein Aab01nite_63030 [Actinoplanes abujensis]
MKKSLVALIVVAVSGTTAAVAGTAAAQERPAPAVVRAAPAPVAAAPAAEAADKGLTYAQSGQVVTVKKGRTRVATVTLTSAKYAAKSASAVLTVKADRPFTIDPALFTVYDLEGWENDPAQTKPVRFGAGTGTLKLTFPKTHARPMALGWVPQLDREAAAVWER